MKEIELKSPTNSRAFQTIKNQKIQGNYLVNA